MNESLELWMIVLLAVLGTVVWRILGVVIGDRIPAQSLFSEWINATAYGMVSGVMMLIIIFPSGLTAETEVSWRLFALLTCLTIMIVSRKLWLSFVGGIAAFSLALIAFGGL